MDFYTQDNIKAKELILKIMNHPGATCFIHGDGMKSLSIVFQRLQLNQIGSIPQFEQEVENVFKLADEMYMGDEMARQLGRYFKQFFKNEMVKTFTNHVTNWSKRVMLLERKLEELQKNNPIEMPYSRVHFLYDSKLQTQLMQERDYTFMVKGIQSIKNKDHIEEIYQIINSMEPELTQNGLNYTISLFQLQVPTVKAVVKKVREILKKENQQQQQQTPQQPQPPQPTE